MYSNNTDTHVDPFAKVKTWDLADQGTLPLHDAEYQLILETIVPRRAALTKSRKLYLTSMLKMTLAPSLKLTFGSPSSPPLDLSTIAIQIGPTKGIEVKDLAEFLIFDQQS